MTAVQSASAAASFLIVSASQARTALQAGQLGDDGARADVRDVVSLSPAAEQALNGPATPDDAAAAVHAVASSLQGMADHLNSLRDFPDPDFVNTVRDGIGDAETEKWLQRMKDHIAETEKNLTDYRTYVAQAFGVSGSLPSKGADGAWSASFTLSSTGKGFAARAGSDGTTEVAVGGKPFKPWSPPPGWLHGASSTGTAAEVTLHTLQSINAAGAMAQASRRVDRTA